MANRLSQELSPYLLQHAQNPVDWYPWGPEALGRAESENRPIFLSIGYSACHWCHVMERESFENADIARQLNDYFVCIKVDREERPDLDQIYMSAVQMLTGRGGWPMSVFLTPDLQPFFGGTYWPPTARMGMPGFDQVLHAVRDAWENRRDAAVSQARLLTDRIQAFSVPEDGGESEPSATMILDAARALEQSFDFTNGGFGQAPKFPHAMDLQVLLRAWHRTGRSGLLEMVRLTLDKMSRGGIYDHLGGGFARYSVDDRWLVPHFEKMLYDNALLAGVYLDGFTATGDENYARVVGETLDYQLAEMTHPDGGFFSTEDADSEGEEGKFYVWSVAEIRSVLGAEAADYFCHVYDVSDSGNFEGQNILNMPKTLEQMAALRGWDPDSARAILKDARTKLKAARQRRIRPGRDDKILVSWNALMIDSLARAGAVLEEDRYLVAASRAAKFLLSSLRGADGRLLHSWRNGEARLRAFQDDYAYLSNGLVSLYESTFDEWYLEQALSLVETMRSHFSDSDKGGFFFTADDHEPLIARQKDLIDSSVPSGNGMAATVLARLGFLCGRADYVMLARDTVAAGASVMRRSPSAAGQLLIALDLLTGGTKEIAILGDPDEAGTARSVRGLRARFIPNKVVALRRSSDDSSGSPALDPIFLGRRPSLVSPTVFLCEKFVCSAPLSGPQAALAKWEQLATPGSGTRDELAGRGH